MREGGERLTHLHAGGVVERLVVHHAVPDYLLLADAALLLGVLGHKEEY